MPIFADLPPPNTHYRGRTVKIVNGKDFPDYVLIGYVWGGAVYTKEPAYLIEPDQYLAKGYKANKLKIFAMKRDQFNEAGGFPGLKRKKVSTREGCFPAARDCLQEEFDVPGVFASNVEIEPYGNWVPFSDPVSDEQIEYSIAGFSNGRILFYESKHTYKYNDGRPDKIEVQTRSS